MCATNKAVIMLALLPFFAIMPSCTQLGPPSGSYKIDTVRFVPSNPKSASAGPAPSIWINTNTELSSLSGGTLKSYLPYGLAFDYTDNDVSFKNAEFTSVQVTYDDGTVDAATNKLKLPLRIPARQHESVNSVSGGRIVKSKVWIISGEIPDVVTRTEAFTLQIQGHFTRHDGSELPFAIDEHFDVEVENSTKKAAEVLQDK